MRRMNVRAGIVAAVSVQVLACGAGWEPPQVRLVGASGSVRQRVAAAVDEAQSGSPREATRLGDLYYALGYPGAAAESYRQAALRSEAAEPRLLAGLASRAAGDLEAARRHFEAALEVDAELKTASLELAALDLEAGDTGAARQAYESLLEDHPDDPRVSHGLARTALADGEAPAAVRWFQRTLALRPHADRVRNGLAEAHRAMGRHDLAREEQARAGSGDLLSDDASMARVGRLRLELTTETVLTLSARDDTSAEEVAGFAVAQLGTVPGAHQGLAERADEVYGSAARGRFWFSVGALADRQADPEAALEAFRKAAELAPEHRASHLRLGRALMKLERMDEAEIALLASGFEEVGVIRDLALIARRRGDFAAAATTLEEAVSASDETGEQEQLLLDLAETRQEQGRNSEALEIYRRIVAAETVDPLIMATAWSRVATYQQARGDDEDAAESFAKAIEATPDWLTPRYALAATLGRLGRYEGAAAAYRAILDLQPTEEQAWLGAATADVFGGAAPEAIRSFLERGITVLPESRPLRATLARHLVVHGGTDPTMATRALELAQGLVEEGASAADRETLAMALAASQRFEDAVRLQQELLSTATAADRPRLKRNLELYRVGRPCCR